MNDIPVIAVDGPSGTGKGTVCSYLADWLGWHFLDSGALYRLLALAAKKRGIVDTDTHSLENLAGELDIEFEVQGAGKLVKVILDGGDATAAIRTEDCGRDASVVAAIPGVRQALLSRQHGFRRAPGLVADGRDMGTVVFPDADLKIFLTASAEERAKRRYKQLNGQGISANLRHLSADISARDERDSQRAISPLKPAEDAVVIDTSEMDIDTVVRSIREHVLKNIPAASK